MHVINPGLDRVLKVLEYFTSPHKKRKYLIVGGTNGKGSVAVTIAKILEFNGYKTALYTSPHLISVTERIKINGTEIEEEELNGILGLVFKKCEEIGIKLSYFELLTASAFIYFDKEEIDIGILEVGMGGRWDATNIVNPLISIITNVSIDHSRYLGDTVKEIAGEKAKIIKENGVVVTSCENEALNVVKAECTKKSAKLYEFGVGFNSSLSKDFSFNYKGLSWRLEDLKSAAKGIYQRNNAVISVATAELLNYYFNYNIKPEKLKNALLHSSFEGRMEYLIRNTPLILDGCHNLSSAQNLVESLKNYHPGEKFIFLISMLNDKNINGFVDKLLPLALKFIVTELPGSGSRSYKAEEIAKVIPCEYEIILSPIEAYNKLLSYNKPSVVCGSLYLIGYLKENLLNEKTRNNKRRTLS